VCVCVWCAELILCVGISCVCVCGVRSWYYVWGYLVCVCVCDWWCAELIICVGISCVCVCICDRWCAELILCVFVCVCICVRYICTHVCVYVTMCACKIEVSEQSIKAIRGSRGITPLILKLGTRWTWVVSFTPRPPYPRRKWRSCTLNRKAGWVPEPFWRISKKGYWPLPGIEGLSGCPVGKCDRFCIRFDSAQIAICQIRSFHRRLR
jgi:hypothetical protein